MAVNGQEHLLKDALVFLFAAGVVVPLFRAIRLPSVLGFILAGVALGPHGLGGLVDRWNVLEYISISEPEAAAPFAELGVLFLLFMLGLELSFAKLWHLRRTVFGAGSLQAGLSAGLIGGVAYLLGLPPVSAAIVGLALALSSTAIVMQLLAEERRTAGPVGRTALSVLLFQDILVAPILIFVGFAAMGANEGLAGIVFESLARGILAIIIIYLIGRYLLRRLYKLAAQAGGRDFLMALVLFTIIGASVITASAGLSLVLGAFLAGLLLAETEFKHQAEVDLEPFKGLLLGLFFMSVGMGLDLTSIWQLLPIVLAGLVAMLLAKALIVVLACRLFAGRMALSVEAAFLLAPAGEFAFVILSVAIAGAVISPQTVTIVSAIAGLSMLLTPVFARLGSFVARRFDEPVTIYDNTDDYADMKDHVIIAGLGRVGSTVIGILEDEEVEIVALDTDPALVARAHDKGMKIFLGDATRPEILSKVGAQAAAMFIVTVDDSLSAEAMVRAIRRLRADVPVFARAHDGDHACILLDAGADYVIPDVTEAGLQLAGKALLDIGYETETVRDRLAAERDFEYQKEIAGTSDEDDPDRNA